MSVARFQRITFAGFSVFLIFLLAISGFAQGRGRGGGAGGGRGSGSAGAGSQGGPPPGVGVDRGLGTASTNSGGRSDNGLGTASSKSGGRSDDGLARARANSLRHADDDLRNNPGLAPRLHTTANDLRSGYQAALLTNPDLKFGHYVAATRLAQNLGSRHPGITRSAILAGLASGRSIGRTLQDLGLSERDADAARKRADREIKEAKR
ncbi:MAG TPA: hypothetical protein VJS64_18100 [Pyrinomonadaceae bacterium]|nr:hypothetical protein [Pyrinomonadaceae bacterium]